MTAPPKSGLTPQEMAELIRQFADHATFCRESLRIRDKTGAMVPFVLQPAQVKLAKAIKKQQAQGVPVRICYLKAGQVMVSSGTAAQMMHAVPFMPGRHCLAVADSEAHAELVFNYYQGYQQNFVPFSGGIAGAEVKLPPLENDRDDTLKWANDSFIKCVTGRNPHVGRSQPWQFVQVSEFGFMDGGAVLMDGLMQRIPQHRDTTLVVESTAFGEGGPFYELCMRTMSPATAGGWQFLFFGWHEHPEYTKPVDDPVAFQRDLSKYDNSRWGNELEEQRKYGLKLEQLKWRRDMILDACEGKLSVFRQEMPANPREAFQSSSRTYLDLGAVERCYVEEPPTTGRLDVFQLGPEKRIMFVPRENEPLRVYRKPKKTGIYVIGADASQGKDPTLKKGGRSDPDWSSATVLDVDTGEQVAKFRERVTEALFAQHVYALGQYYNWAYLVPEVVGHGRALMQALLALQYPTDRIYAKQRQPGDLRPPNINELGFETNSVNRPMLLSDLDLAFHEGAITIYDENTVMECRTLIQDTDGVVAAKLGRHDDDVFSLALAIRGLKTYPRHLRQASGGIGTLPHMARLKPVSYRYGQERKDDDD
jgi:hypothetical protein